MSQQPVVSVIVTTKNNTETLLACLQSIKDQTYGSIELIIVDNHSTDDTVAIAKAFTDHVYIKGPERCAQRNYAATKASGEHMVIIDSDMELAPTVVAECVAAVQADPAVQGVVIHEESFGVGHWAQAKALERSFYVNVSWIEAARFFRTATFRTLHGYDETLVSGEDWDLSKRAEKLGKLTSVNAMIRHNEGRINLTKSLKKKYYYAQHAASYLKQNPERSMLNAQVGPINRYKLFLSQPSKLLRNPVLGTSMLFMKTAEFAAGAAGYIHGKRKA